MGKQPPYCTWLIWKVSIWRYEQRMLVMADLVSSSSEQWIVDTTQDYVTTEVNHIPVAEMWGYIGWCISLISPAIAPKLSWMFVWWVNHYTGVAQIQESLRLTMFRGHVACKTVVFSPPEVQLGISYDGIPESTNYTRGLAYKRVLVCHRSRQTERNYV